MYLADYHTHSCVSPDASFHMLDMARAAQAAGLDEICFTDHFEPFDQRTSVPQESFDWAAQTAEFASASAQWDGPVKLRLGLELGDALLDYPRTERLLKGRPEHDFVIGSVHMLSEKFERMDISRRDEPDEAACYAEIEDYLELLLQMARWGKFNVLGHLTLPLRYMNERRGFHVSMDQYGAELEDVLRALLENGCGIELNTNRGGQMLPAARWLKLYRSLGGEIITLGSDAHRLEDVGRGIRDGQALLQECGFTRWCTFEHQKPIWHAL